MQHHDERIPHPEAVLLFDSRAPYCQNNLSIDIRVPVAWITARKIQDPAL